MVQKIDTAMADATLATQAELDALITPGIRVLDAQSLAASQEPAGLDTPKQIEFGAAQFSASDPVMISAAGALTINKAGVYTIETTLQFGRTGSTGVSHLGFRALANGVQSGRTICAYISDADDLKPFEYASTLYLPAGVVLTYEIIRFTGGNNSGGLFRNGVVAGWNADASAHLRVIRLRDWTPA